MHNPIQYTKGLEAAGFSREQAEQVNFGFTAIGENMVTKTEFAEFRSKTHSDFADFRSQMNSEFADFRSQMNSEFAEFRAKMHAEFLEFRSEMRSELAAFRVEMAKANTDLVLKLGGLVMGANAVMVAAIGILIAIMQK